jgi:hypothetical protein
MEVNRDERNYIYPGSAVQGSCSGVVGNNHRAAGISNLADITLIRGA